MKEQLAATNKLVLAVVLMLVIVAMSVAWYMLSYKHDRATIATNQMALDQVNTQLAAKKADLAKVNVDKSPDRSAIPKIALGQTAIPADTDLAGGLLQLQDTADRSGVVISNITLPEDPSGGSDVPAGNLPQPTTIEVDGHAPYAQIMMFIDNIEAPVSAHGGKLYVAGRLMNVSNITFNDGLDAEKTNGSADTGVGAINVDGASTLPKGHRVFKLTVVMYSKHANTASAADGSASSDASSAASSSGAAAAGSTGSTDSSAGAAPGATNGSSGTTPDTPPSDSNAPAAGSSVPSGVS